MAKKRGVSIIVDEKFFKTFDKERRREQNRLREKMGGFFNLSQKNFTALLASKKFRFTFPQNIPGRPILRKRRRLR